MTVYIYILYLQQYERFSKDLAWEVLSTYPCSQASSAAGIGLKCRIHFSVSNVSQKAD